MAVAPYILFRTEEIQKVVDWLIVQPLPYRDTDKVVKILLAGHPQFPDVIEMPTQPSEISSAPDPQGMV